MLGQNLIRVLIILIIANLAFVVGLEIQRRTIWSEEAEYLRKIEAYTLSNAKSEADYTDIRKRLGNINEQIRSEMKDIRERVGIIQTATQDNQAAVAAIKDLREKINHVETMMEQQPAVSRPQDNPPK